MIRVSALVSLMILSTGCIIEESDDQPGPSHFCGDGIVDPPVETCDDGNNASGDGCSAACKLESAGDAAITANWNLKSLATNTNATCPPGFDTAAIYNQPVDANGNSNGQPIIDLFDCAAKTGTARNLPPQLYQTWIEITNHDNTNVYAKSLSAFVDVTAEDKTFSAEILTDGGYFQLSWSLKDAQTNAPMTCAQAASTGVEAIGSLVSSPADANSDIFDCEDGYGVTAGYPAANYTVAIHALGAGDAQLGDSVVVNTATIETQNKVTDLGMFMLPID